MNMNVQRFQALLGGESPSLNDYAIFVSVIEKLPVDLLWEIANNSPSLHGILRTVVTKTLQEKIARKNVDDSLDSIVNGMREFFI
jgi:hypothetical protein